MRSEHEAGEQLMAARLKERYESEIKPQLIERFGYKSAMQVPRLEKITLNMGVGEAKLNTELLDAAAEQLGVIAGQKPADPPGAQVDRELQAARGHAGRRQGDAARRAHVGDARPPAVDRDPADPRLPRAQPALVRRSRQLLDGHPRADHLSRDRLRLDRPGPRPRRHDHDHGRDRRGGAASCCGCSACRSAARTSRPDAPPRCGRQQLEADAKRGGRGSRPRRAAEGRAAGRDGAEEPRSRRGRRASRRGAAAEAAGSRRQAQRTNRSRWQRHHR